MKLTGSVVLLPPADLLGSLLRVALEDVTLVDDGVKLLGEQWQRIDGKGIEAISFSFDVELDGLASRRYALRAEIHRGDPVQLTEGDYISTVAHPFHPLAPQREWLVHVSKI